MPIFLFLILIFNSQANDLDQSFVDSVNRSDFVLTNPSGTEEQIFRNLLRETLNDRNINVSNISITIPISGVLNHLSNVVGNSFVGEYGWDNKSDFYRHFTFERRVNGTSFIYECFGNIDAISSNNNLEYSLSLSSCESRIKGGVGENIGIDIGFPILSPTLNRVSDELRDADNRRGGWGRGTPSSSPGSTRE